MGLNNPIQHVRLHYFMYFSSNKRITLLEIKLLISRLTTDSFPQMNLKHWLIQVLELCPVCDSNNEEVGHVLFRCRILYRVPLLCGIDTFSFPMQLWGSSDLVYSFLGSLGKDLKELSACCLWQIWNNRNLIVFEGFSKNSEFIALSTKNFLSRFHTANVVPRFFGTPLSRWSPLPLNCLKVNFDIATFSNSKTTGTCVVIRNSNDEFVAAMSK